MSQILSRSVIALSIPILLAAPLIVSQPASAATPSEAAVESTVVDSAFNPGDAVRVDDDGNPIGRANPCHDRAFAAIPKMLLSVPGCGIIGASKNTTLTYSWYRDRGRVGVCVWAKGFNSRAQTTWTQAGCGTGRRGVRVHWGNVSATKQIKGMTASGVAGVQWG